MRVHDPQPERPVRPAVVLQQPHERPASMVVKADDAPSWWVGLSREDLNREARERFDVMRGSREAKRLHYGTINE